MNRANCYDMDGSEAKLAPRYACKDALETLSGVHAQLSRIYVCMHIHVYIYMIRSRLFSFPNWSPKIESRNVVFAHAYAYAYASAHASASDTVSAFA